MLRPHTPLFNVASDAPDAGGSADTAPKATIGQQLRAALSSKSELTARLDTAQASLQTVTQERDDARAALATAQARVTELEAQLAEVNAALGEHQKEVEQLKTKEQDLNKRASDQAKQIVRGIGIEASKLPAAQTGDEAPSVDALRSKLADESLSSEARGEIVKQIRQIQAQK